MGRMLLDNDPSFTSGPDIDVYLQRKIKGMVKIDVRLSFMLYY